MKSNLKSFSITVWTNELSRLGLLSESAALSLNRYDSNKVTRLEYLYETIGLPIDVYLSVPGAEFVEGNSDLIALFSGLKGEVFSVRAEPFGKDASEMKLPTARSHGLDQRELFEFIEKLLPGKHFYRIRLCVYFVPDLSGHILISETGILIEATLGKLMGISQQWISKDQLIHAKLAFPCMTFTHSTEDTRIRSLLWEAIKYLRINKSRPISPHSLPRFYFGYYEFVFSNRHGFRFVDFNQSSLFAGDSNGISILTEEIQVPNKLRAPTWHA